MYILQINKFFYIRDGTSRYFMNVSKLLMRKRHNLSYFSMKDPRNFLSKYQDYFISNISYRNNIFSNIIKIFKRIFYSKESRYKISKLFDDTKVNIVHIHSIYHHISPSILFEIRRRNIPIVMSVQDFHIIAPNYLLFHNQRICEITKPDKYYKALIHKCVKDSILASITEVTEKYLQNIFGWERTLVDLFIVPTNFIKDKLIEYGIIKSKYLVYFWIVENIYQMIK